MSKSRQKTQDSTNINQQTNNTLDSLTEKTRAELAEAARGAANGPGPSMDPRVQSAGGFFGGMQNLGLDAMKILGGDSGAISGAMNPYLKNVVAANDTAFDKVRAQATTGLQQQATRAGAYGGSRHGVAQGIALGEINSAQAAKEADLYKGGYDDVMSRALGSANLGFGGAQANQGLGQYITGFNAENDPAMRKFRIYQSLMGSSPYTTNTSTTGRTASSGNSKGYSASVGELAAIGKMAAGMG